MKLLKTLKGLKLGQKVAWHFSDKYVTTENDMWACISQVKGFHKKTKYLTQDNGVAYETTEKIVFDILAINHNEMVNFLLTKNSKMEIYSDYIYDEVFKIWLIETEQEYLDILKEIMVDNL